MDDTNWISGSKQNMIFIFIISKEFFFFTNILINDFKAKLITTNDRIGQYPIEKILDYWTGLIGDSPLQVQLSLYSPINIVQ